MAMARKGDREVCFRLCMGNLTVDRVTVVVYDPLADQTEIHLEKERKVWTTKHHLPISPLYYNYRVEMNSKSIIPVWQTVKNLVGAGSKKYVEERYRQLPTHIVTCRDVFETPKLMEQYKLNSVHTGFVQTHLQSLVDSLKNINDLKAKLHELEHMSRAFNEQLFSDSHERNRLKLWIDKPFVSYATSPHILVLLSALYGRIANDLVLHLHSISGIPSHVHKKILGALENVERSELTEWSRDPIRVTVLQALKAAKKNHWIYAATSFPYLFEVSRIIELSKDMSRTQLQANALDSVLIPKLRAGYTKDEVIVLLSQLSKAGSRLSQDVIQVIEKYTKPFGATRVAEGGGPRSEQKPHSVDDVFTGARSSSSPTVGNTPTMDIKYPPKPIVSREKGSKKESPESRQAKEAKHMTATQLEEPQKHLSSNASDTECTRTTTKVSMDADEFDPTKEPQEQNSSNTECTRSTTTVSVDLLKPSNVEELDPNKGIVKFQLLIREEKVSEVRLFLKNKTTGEEQTHPMKYVTYYPNFSKQYGTSWRCASIIITLPSEHEFSYFYIVTMYTSSMFTSAKFYEVRDNTKRHVHVPNVTSDIFWNETNTYAKEIQAHGTVVYAELTLQNVNSENLKKALMGIEDIGFPGMIRRNEYIYSIVTWIQNSIRPYYDFYCPLEEPQVQFLAVLLGKLININGHIERKTLHEECVRHIIDALKSAKPLDFPKSVGKDLTHVCTWLVCFCQETWLHIWMYFHCFLNLETLVNMKKAMLLSPDWSQSTWAADEKLLSQAMNALQDKPLLVESLFLQCIEEVQDVKVLRDILIMYSSSIEFREGSKVHDHALNQLNKILKNRLKTKIASLVQAWNDMRDAQLKEMSDVVRVYVVMYMKDHQWNMKDKYVIQKAVCNRELYSSFEDLKNVIQNMVKQYDYPDVYENFLTIIQDSEILACANQNQIQDLLKIGIQSLSQKCKTRQKNEAVRMVYKILGLTRDCDHLKVDERIQSSADRFGYDAMKEVPVECLFGFLAQKHGCDLQEAEIRIVGEHTRRRLHDSPATVRCSLKELKGSDGSLRVSSVAVRDVLLAMIEDEVLPASLETIPDDTKVSKFESGIAKIISDGEFWLMLLTASGEYSEPIHSHTKCKIVIDSLANSAKMIFDGNVTLNFLRQFLSKNMEMFIELLLVTPQYQKSKTSELRNKFKQVNSMETLLKCKLDNLNRHFKVVGHLRYTIRIDDDNSLAAKINCLRQLESDGCVTLREVEDTAWWGDLFPLISIADGVSSLADSTIFLNICRSIVEHTCTSICSVPDNHVDGGGDAQVSHYSIDGEATDQETSEFDDKPPGVRTLHSVWAKQVVKTRALGNFLHDICIPTFNEHCVILLSGNLDVPTNMVQNMMDGIGDTERLVTELKEVERIFTRTVPYQMRKALKNLVELPDLTQRSSLLKAMFCTFGVSEEETDDIHTAIQCLTDLHLEEGMTLQHLNDALQKVAVIENDFDAADWEIIEMLASSQELVDFLGPLIDEDFRNLIDAVEERSEQHVGESTVSDLIDVKRFLETLLKVQPPNHGKKLIDAIRENRKLASEIKGLPVKIDSCVNNVHGLRDLYNNVANRGEMTKEIIHNALQQGIYVFRMDGDDKSGCCNVVLTYKRGKEGQTSKALYGLNELNDLRSRALLNLNIRQSTPAEDMAGDESSGQAKRQIPDFEKFVRCVNCANDIRELCNGLRESGHFSFRCFEESVHTIHELEHLKEGLQERFDKWHATLKEARQKYNFLNYFHSKQLLQLDLFFQSRNPVTEDIALLFRYVDSRIILKPDLSSNYESPLDKNDLKARLFHLGMALDNTFSAIPPSSRRIPGQDKAVKSTVDTTVRKGFVFVAELDEDSAKTIPVLLELYKNTTGELPEPSQVVFCHSGTSWEEISLLLQRCVGARNHFEARLFALANVELLPTEIQFQLVTAVKQTQESSKDFLLAIICRGGSYHHIIDQFSPNYTHRLHGLTDTEMRSCLQSGWKEVEVVTSSRPGLGKTEYIKDSACERNFGVRSIPISGPIMKEDLVERVHALAGMNKEVLHIDLASVSDPRLLDTFIFEIIVFEMAVSGTQMCMLPTRRIVIEVANTQKDKLRNALSVCSSFKRTHLEWNGFHDFLISKDINSSVQVVCHYLKALGNGTLDTKDITFTGQNHASPLTANECRSLLNKYYGSVDELSYTVVNSFLVIFAQELRRMSASLYFTTESLKDMLGNSNDVRSNFVDALLNVAKDFTARSVKSQSTDKDKDAAAALMDYRSGSSISASQMVSRMQGMVKWADSNHLLVVFHRQDSQTISTLYRMLNKVPKNICKLFETQMKRNLPKYDSMPQDKLHDILEKVCRNTRAPFKKENLKELQTNYALTPDNLLKMILIYMRIKAGIPVIIMGETGCGKTTLITYLARVCEVSFEILNLHAGISELDIVYFIESLQTQANKNLKQEVWGFLDEINTCDHLGVLNEVLCHHSLKGKPLPNNLKLIAACNPYTMREGTVVSTGLESKHRRDEMSNLVYRVHPLPETMMDFVWDYGSLDKKDEEAYIRRMLESKDQTFVDLIVMSQEFMRQVEQTTYCVSLRDVNRCQHLANWFTNMLKKKTVAHVEGDVLYANNLGIRSMVLALAHCYHSRLTMSKDRVRYRQEIASIFRKAKSLWDVKEKDIDNMIRAEQLNILDRMHLPEGIAKNEALRENVFVILVSILNRIPVFVVGKPGCSKSLSMQLIKSNLRGRDSKDLFFKSLPPVYVVSYQGSESSTSEGIVKVFEKAKNYKKHNPDVLPVVLLDEIGLAEVSSYNPLKVLHSQLEPTVGGFPPVAVVGISNWALDAAKMNRAIHLSRPEPTIEDLADTAKSIRDDSAKKRKHFGGFHVVNEDKLKRLAEAYRDYQVDQIHVNFHGLRDYYSLVKYVAIQSSVQVHGEPGLIIEKGILRNFGGLKIEMPRIMNTFMDKIGLIQQPTSRPGIMDLITENMDDTQARHLMLITSGDSALNILEQTLEGREHVTIFGSRFENDVSEEYSYTTLSEIILCMERGVTLVLRDLENIYGSLYDMLNQNYTVVAKKRNCRVALGPYSNPMCQVHDKFRCIVLVDEQKVDYQNPPFLNRFEKQTLRFNDILTDPQVAAIGCLRRWMDDICSIEGFQFSQESMFLGLHNDTLPSLVFLRSKDADLPVGYTPEDLARRCQEDLMKVACPDAVLRASKSKLAQGNRSDVQAFQEAYFKLPLQNGLQEFFEEHRLQPTQPTQHQSFAEDEYTSATSDISSSFTRTVIYTHSSIHTDVNKCFEGVATVQIEKLSKFKSERQFASQMRHFWFDAEENLLVLQCITSHDAAHMLLAKNRIDQYRSEYLSGLDAGDETSTLKHACIIVHIDRGEQDESEMFPWQFNFLCGWEQYTLDTLEASETQLEDLLQGSISDQLAERVDLEAIIQEQLLWCFSCIKYENQPRDVESAMQLASDAACSVDFVNCLKMQILDYIREKEKEDSFSGDDESYSGWQVEVATNTDLLYRCSTLEGAMQEYIKLYVKEPLGKCIILLESVGAWSGSPLSIYESEDTMEFWQTCFHDPAIFNIRTKTVPVPRGPESCLVSCKFLDRKYPFFTTFHAKIEGNREWLMHNYPKSDGPDNICDQLQEIIGRMSELYHDDYLGSHVRDYEDDLFNEFSSTYVSSMSYENRIKVMGWLVVQLLPPHEEESNVEHRLALLYITIWSHMNLLAAQLQLVSIYQTVTKGCPKQLIQHIQRQIDGFNPETNSVIPDSSVISIQDSDGAFAEDIAEDSGIGQLTFTNSETTTCADDDEQAYKNNHSLSFIEYDENIAFSAGSSSEHQQDSLKAEEDRRDNIADDVISPDEEFDQEPVIVKSDNETNIDREYIDRTHGSLSLEDIDTENLPGEIEKPDSNVISPSDETAETLLVTKVCRDILPSEQVLLASGGIGCWHRKATAVLLLAGQVSVESPILHFLRLCRDLIVMLSRDFEITEEKLAALSSLGKDVEDPLSSNEVFNFIISFVDDVDVEDTYQQRVLDNFLTSYFSLCLAANLDTPLLELIIETIATSSGHLLTGSRPIMVNIILNDINADDAEDGSIGVCDKLILTEELDGDLFPNLALIDEILVEQKIDSSLSVVCCDVIQETGFKHLTCSYIANMTTDSDKVWEMATVALEVVSNPDQVSSSLRLVTAAAFIRAFLEAIAELIHVSDIKHFKIDGKYFVIAQTLNGLLRVEDGGLSETGASLPLKHLLKSLRQYCSLCDLRKLCDALCDPITNLRKIKWEEKLFMTRLGYTPLGYVDHYNEAMSAISAWQTRQDSTKVKIFISTAISNPSYRLALLAAVVNTFYLIQTTKGLRDVDRQEAEWLFKESAGFSDVYKHFLQRLLGLADFTGILHISESSSQEHVQIVSVLVHLVAVIVSYAEEGGSSPAFLSILDHNKPITDIVLPGSGKLSSVMKKPDFGQIQMYDCPCGMRIVAQTDLPSDCPQCHQTRQTVSNESDKGIGETKPRVYIQDNSLECHLVRESTESVPHLSPMVYRVLDTLIHSCITASVCTGLITEEQVMGYCTIEEEAETSKCKSDHLSEIQGDAACGFTSQENDDSSNQSTDVKRHLLMKLERNWRLLCEITQLNFESVTLFLHRVIRNCTPEITTLPCPLNEEKSFEYEETFSDVITTQRRKILNSLKEQKRECFEADGVDITCLESELEELDLSNNQTPPDSKNRDDIVEEDEVEEDDEVVEDENVEATREIAKIKSLLRKKNVANQVDFQAQFANICQTNENKYIFLKLCLSRLELLHYVRYLPDLLKWNSLVIGRLNHSIKRQEARQTKIRDFLSNDRFHSSDEDQLAASHAFSSFQKAWNNVRDDWKKLTGTDPPFNHMTPDRRITDCVVDRKDQDCFLRRMINVLLGIQNTFLMDSLAIAASGHSAALIFLIKDEGVAGIPTVPLHAADTSIIQYQWKDDILVYHDVETDYGFGSVIEYKYDVIERELARMLVLNKALLVEGSGFTQFAYSDELFHTCSDILSDIGNVIIQQKLPKESVNTIKREQDHRQTFAKDMLDHLEVILVLLKKTGGDPCSSLYGYIKRWSNKLPGSFTENLLPEPRDAVKLQHVVHLYETLEDLLVDAVVDSLHDDYRKELPKRGEDALIQKLKPLSLENLEETATVIRRFIFRFIRSSPNTNTNSNLHELVLRSAAGAMDCALFLDILPDDLEVKHVVKILEFLDKQAEQRKDVTNKKEIRHQPRQPRAGTRTTRSTNRPTRRRSGVLTGVS